MIFSRDEGAGRGSKKLKDTAIVQDSNQEIDEDGRKASNT